MEVGDGVVAERIEVGAGLDLGLGEREEEMWRERREGRREGRVRWWGLKME